MNRNFKILLTVLALLVLGAVGLLLWQKHHTEDHPVAHIYQNGVLLREIPLDRVIQPEQLVVEGTDGAYNTILIEPGRIRISDASCPDQLCVHQGWISHRSVPLVCLPNQVVIQIQGGGDGVDTVTG